MINECICYVGHLLIIFYPELNHYPHRVPSYGNINSAKFYTKFFYEMDLFLLYEQICQICSSPFGEFQKYHILSSLYTDKYKYITVALTFQCHFQLRQQQTKKDVCCFQFCKMVGKSWHQTCGFTDSFWPIRNS